MIGPIRRTFHYMDQEVFRLLFTSLMRPHMDYADCIWSPHLKVDIAQLENAQRRATWLVPDLRDRCYEDRLMTGIDDLEASNFFTMNSRETRGHGKKIMKQPSRLNLRKFSFSHRVVDDWNSLPSKVVEARDVEQFKQSWMKRGKTSGFCTLPYKPQILRESDLKAKRRDKSNDFLARRLQVNTSGESDFTDV